MISQSTSRVSWSLLVTLCIWVASGEGMSLNGLDASQRRQAQRAAHQSSSLCFLLDASCPGESVEDPGDLQVGERASPDLASAYDSEIHRRLEDGGAHGYFLPLARAPGL